MAWKLLPTGESGSSEEDEEDEKKDETRAEV
jgi:hypothetical protein